MGRVSLPLMIQKNQWVKYLRQIIAAISEDNISEHKWQGKYFMATFCRFFNRMKHLYFLVLFFLSFQLLEKGV
jgi:hypothetical protein